jgi:hypothetical protein
VAIKIRQNVQSSVTLWQSKYVKMYNLVSPCGNQNIVYMYVQTSVNLWQSKHLQNVQPGVTLWQSKHPQHVQHCGNENMVHMFIQMVACVNQYIEKTYKGLWLGLRCLTPL